MNPIHLAQAIVHWLEYQSICGRSELFCEAYLAQPIGEYCLSLRPEHFEAECPFPPEYQKGVRRKRSLDFAVFGRSSTGKQKVLIDAIETKFVTSRRDFTQEIYDDLFRLLWFQSTREPNRCRRWLVTAGFSRNLAGENFLASKVQLGRGKGKPKTAAFKGLLSADLTNHTRTKQIHLATPVLRNLWVEAAANFGQDHLPDEVTVRLAGRAPVKAKPTDPSCYVWEVIRPPQGLGTTHQC